MQRTVKFATNKLKGGVEMGGLEKGVEEKIMSKVGGRRFFVLLTLVVALAFSGGVSSALSEESKGFEAFGLLINGKFDVSFELREFYGDPFQGKPSLTNYHKFIFISRRKAEDKFFFTAEVIERYFYEFGARFEKVEIKFGKVLVPFGADPLFHHNYGGLTGFDQKFVPFVWSEHGGVFTSHILKKPDKKLILSNDFFLVNAPGGDPAKEFSLGKADPSRFAVGDRVKFGYSHLIIYGSLYWTQYAKGYNFFMWGGDVSLAYGFLPYSFLKNLSLKAGFAYENVEGDPKKMGNYFHFSDYLRIDYKLPLNLTFRFLVGTKTMLNYKYPFYDKDTADQNDETAYNFALIYRRGGFFTQFQYVVKVEAKEQKDDFARIMVGFEF
ncbi:hypothetical protein HRbin19_00519 [bacterium HR19]|nr:hypothetical protein HRbin19_00519 [bacterium HR19]